MEARKRIEKLQSKVVEGIAISHFLIHREIPFLRTAKTFLWIYYDKNGREMDAIIRENDGYLGIEVKYRAQISKKSIKGIAPIKKYIILSKEEVGKKEGTIVVPVDIFLSLLPISDKNI